MEDLLFQKELGFKKVRHDSKQKAIQQLKATKKRRRATKIARKQRKFNLINS